MPKVMKMIWVPQAPNTILLTSRSVKMNLQHVMMVRNSLMSKRCWLGTYERIHGRIDLVLWLPRKMSISLKQIRIRWKMETHTQTIFQNSHRSSADFALVRICHSYNHANVRVQWPMFMESALKNGSKLDNLSAVTFVITVSSKPCSWSAFDRFSGILWSWPLRG